MERVEKGVSPKEAAEELTREDAMLEAVMLGLRMVEEGVNGALFAERFGLSAGDAFSGWDGLASEGLVIRRGQDFKLTEKGLLFLNETLLRLTPKAP
jgi:coproporphyrinogen III oxidase-like Fe-S oxidoreductase